MSKRPASRHLGAIIPTPPSRMFGDLSDEELKALGFSAVASAEGGSDVVYLDADGREYESDDRVPAAAFAARAETQAPKEKDLEH